MLRNRDRTNYCIFKECALPAYPDEDSFKYAEIKQQLAINDLKRFGMQTLLVNEYTDITTLLKQIENRHQRKTVLISGSAHEYGAWTPTQAESFVRTLSQALIRNVKAHNPPYTDSRDVYNYISENLADWIEEAIEIRDNYTA